MKRALAGDGNEKEVDDIRSYHDAVRAAVDGLPVNVLERNVLVAHQFVTGAKKCDSEDVSVGGLDNIGAEVFDAFDYVALGHIHSPQNVGDERVRYCGTPLKYSFSECGQTKSVTMVELKEKGSLEVRLLPLVPWRELRQVRGTYDEVMSKEVHGDWPVDADGRLRDFFQITLTDEQDVLNAVHKLRSVYKNLLQLLYDNKRTQQEQVVEGAVAPERKSELELFAEFYQLQNNQEMNEVQKAFMKGLIADLKEAEA